jgi:hypothetical protein
MIKYEPNMNVNIDEHWMEMVNMSRIVEKYNMNHDDMNCYWAI